MIKVTLMPNKFKKEFNYVFSQTEFDTSSKSEICPKHNLATRPRNLSIPGNCLREFSVISTHLPPLKFDDDDEFSSATNYF